MRAIRSAGRWSITTVSNLWAPLFITFSLAFNAAAQSDATTIYHQIEGRIQHHSGTVRNVRVRLLRLPEMRPITETFSRPEGQFTFNQVTEGDYAIETFETEEFEATLTNVQVRPNPRRPTLFTVFVELPLKAREEKVARGELMADVDVNVPKNALKHFNAGVKKLEKGESAEAIIELKTAVEVYPKYYAARLELGRELRLQKRFQEALPVIQPLIEIAPKRAEPHIEFGIILLGLERRDDAIKELNTALELEETNWAAHLYLGWALLESDGSKAETHFSRALELDEQKAARAHLALARLAEGKGNRALALAHLDAYLVLAPKAHDAEATRKLAEQLRAKN
jgi:Flp pilus assembly protein TadD